MQPDLLFHLTTKEEWRTYSSRGFVAPESLQTEGFIHTSLGTQVEETANRIFSGRDDMLLLVIDPMRIQEPIKYEVAENGEKYPHIYGKFSIDAVIDKLTLIPDKKGVFSINVKHFD